VAENSNIEWTESTWNPVTGCSKVSPGCKNCYAERMAGRLRAMGCDRYRNGFDVTLHPDLLEKPLSWRKPRAIFVNSMSDLFHENVPDGFIMRVFETMNRADWHTFQILTKRSRRLKEIARRVSWSKNIWMGASVESSDYLWRIEDLRAVPASVRFLSVEPLLGPIPSLNLDGIHWVIVGGESGSRSRPMKPSWVKEIYKQCRNANVPFFFKQWGGPRKDITGRKLFGRTYEELPLVG